MSLSIKRMDAPWCVLEEANNFISFIDWLPKKIELLVRTPPPVRPYLTLNLKFTASILLRQRSHFKSIFFNQDTTADDSVRIHFEATSQVHFKVVGMEVFQILITDSRSNAMIFKNLNVVLFTSK